MPAAPFALRDPRPGARRLLRRHRRPVAAAVAGVGALVALTALRGTPTDPAASPFDGGTTAAAVRTGEVAVPVVLASGAITASLAVGDVIDVIGLTRGEPPTATVVAPRARIIELPSAGSGLTGSSAAVVLVAVPESAALPLSAASASGGLTVVIRAR